ncbi:MAG: signal peptidase II [Candidatus Ratteibacteria bacterium]
MGFFYSSFAIAFLIDRITKLIVTLKIPENFSVKICRFLYINNIKNGGICFGFLENPSYLPLIIILSVIALFVILLYVHNRRLELPIFSHVCFGLICGGILGNLYDRALYRGVIDFIDFLVWPVFNLADTFIVCGIGCLLIFYSRSRKHASSVS